MEQAAISTQSAPDCSVGLCVQCQSPVQEGQVFCCAGCEAAYNMINQSGVASNIVQLSFAALATKDQDGIWKQSLIVRGMHCVACIKRIEDALLAEDDVVFARVNMSTERLTMRWRGSNERAGILVKKITDLGYEVRPKSEVREKRDAHEKFLLRCMAVAGFASGNLMMISLGLWSSNIETMGAATRDFFHVISALIALPTVVWAGRPFFYSAAGALKNFHTNMDVPISLAMILACAMSVLETITHGEHVYFDSAVMLLFFLLIGRYLDVRAKGKVKESAGELLSLLDGTALVLKYCKSKPIAIRHLQEGMIAVVAVGENIPADGVVHGGVSELDMSLITGETLPQKVTAGDTVFAGTVNMNSPIQVRVTKAGEDSLLGDIVKLMEKAEQSQSYYVRMADKAARLYTPVVHVLALLTLIGWMLAGSQWQPALLNAITVLIITCPCALGLAVPVVHVLASGCLMRRGVLLKSGDALERLATVGVAVFDKTGTLTLGKPTLLQPQSHDWQQLQLAASLAVHSKHPLSRAIYNVFEGELLDAQDISEEPGCGLEAKVDGRQVRLGSRLWCGDKQALQKGKLELWLSEKGKKPMCFSFADDVRPDTSQTIAALQHLNIKTVLLSGDREQVVKEVASVSGISSWKAQCSPVDKCEYIESLQREGHVVLMVGDGLNDAPALAMADVSISPSAAMDITQNSADIVFQGQSLTPVFGALKMARDTTSLVKQNFMLALFYNIIAIPLAVFGYVTPLVAAVAMSGSSLVVVANSFRLNLKTKKL